MNGKPHESSKIARGICVLCVFFIGLITIVGSTGGPNAPDITYDGLYTSVAIDDLNGDGAIDIAVSYVFIDTPPPHRSQLAVFLQNPLAAGSFQLSQRYTIGYDGWWAAIGDLNNDSLPDIVTANEGGHNLTILFQDSTRPGYFTGATNLPTGMHPTHVSIGDINGDGLPDIAVADRNTTILLQDAGVPGTFSPVYNLGFGSNCIAIGDINADGLVDLAITGAASGAVSVLHQDPMNIGDFLPATDYATGQQPTFVSIGLIDDDLLPDLAVVNYGSPTGSIPASVSVLLHDPMTPGNFIASNSYVTAARSNQVAIDDLNGDASADLAVVNPWRLDPNIDIHGTVSVLLQNPLTPGMFLAPSEYNIDDSQSLSLAIGDLNGDLLPDIAVASDGVRILFQNSSSPGNFLPSSLIGG